MSLLTSILTGGINNHETTSEEANGVVTDFVSEGIVGDLTNTAGVAPATGGFAVNATGTPDTNVQISAGVAYVTGTPSSQNSQTFRVKNTATAALAISANSSGSTKYDWIYIKLDATNLNAPNTAGDNVATIVASRSSSSSADDGTPPTYGYPIAVVTVANGFSTITNGNIRDIRVEAGLTPTPTTVSTESWTSAGATPSSISYNGNRSYSLTWPLSIVSTRSVGMRNKYTRSSTAPTRCTDLETSSTQYYSRASGSLTGITFTDDFVVSAWIKLESYPGSAYYIASRYNGTSGWECYIDSSGRVVLSGKNAGAANFSLVQSYQSVPRDRWVHVAAQLDMSAFTATTTTSYVMIDGVDVPAAVSRGGTNPTALVQAGNLEIGAGNGGGGAFDGKLAQVAIYNAKVTQATIKGSISQTLSGSETSLISAYSFNNTINDLNANANNLTAQNSAVATNTDSPFSGGDSLYETDGTTEYAITTAISSDGLTETVQVPEGYAIPTSGGVSAVSYSTQAVPYGFPRQKNKWRIYTLVRTTDTQASPTAATWYNLGPTTAVTGGQQIQIPIGEWMYGYGTNAYADRTGSSAGLGCHATLSTANNTESDTDLTGKTYLAVNSAVDGGVMGYISREKGISLAALTSFFLNYRVGTTGAATNITSNRNSAGDVVIYADLALL